MYLYGSITHYYKIYYYLATKRTRNQRYKKKSDQVETKSILENTRAAIRTL